MASLARCRWCPARFAAKRYRYRYSIELLEQDYNTVAFTAAALLTPMARLIPCFEEHVAGVWENQETRATERKIMSIEIARIKKSLVKNFRY